MKEKAVLLGKTKSLVGIVTEPSSSVSGNYRPAIIILNAGLLHRVGPNRLHVKMARKLAAIGFTVLRFDFSGIGDSSACNDNIPFEESAPSETQEAMNYLSCRKNIERFILIGICTGADVALKTTYCNDRIVGAVGINGLYIEGNISKESIAYIANRIRTRYYRKYLFDYKSWWRLITGKSNLYGVAKLLATKMKNLLTRNTPSLPKTHIPTTLFAKGDADLLLVYSEGSPAYDTFQVLHKKNIDTLTSSKKVSIEIIKHSDHVFTLLESQDALMNLIYQWVTNQQRSWLTGFNV